MPTGKYTAADVQGKYTADDVDDQTAPTPVGGDLRVPTMRERFLNPEFYPVGAKGETVGENLKNLFQRGGVGVFQLADALVNPRKTAAGTLASVLPEPVVKGINKVVDVENKIPLMHYLTTKLPEGTENPVQTGYQAAATSRTPTELAGKAAPLAGQMIAGQALPGVVEAVTKDVRAVPDAVRSSPRTVRDLITEKQKTNAAETQRVADKNAAETAKANEANLKQAGKREAQVEKHGQEKIDAEKTRVERQNAADRKVALERGVEHLEPELKGQLENSFQTAKANANKPYDELGNALEHAEGADGEQMRLIIADGMESMRGSPQLPTVLKNMMDKESPFTFDDLQGYREEIGRELRKGTLPPDVFDAYKKMIEGITTQMEDIARRADVAEQMKTGKNPGFEAKLKAARAGYRKYAEVFLDKDSPIHKALQTGIQSKPGDFIKSFSGRDEAIERLAQFDPDIARRINTVRGHAAEAKSIRPSTAKPKEAAPLPPKPAPVQPKLSTPNLEKISAEDIQNAKKGKLADDADTVQSKGKWGATILSLYALRGVLHGDFSGAMMVPYDVAGSMLATRAIAGIMRRPSFVEFMSKATEKDLAQVPPELRADLPGIVQAAQKQGVQVSPALAAAVSGAAAPKKLRDAFPAQPPRDQFMAAPNPKGMVEKGNLPIWSRPVVSNADGTKSTEYSTSFQDDQGREVLVPTVVNGKFLTPDGKKPPEGGAAEKAMFKAAWDHYLKTGENLGKFDNPDDADAYAQVLHNREQ